MICTDHAPHHYDAKEREFDDAPNGIIGLETALGLAITELVDGGLLDLPTLVRRMSTMPARIFKPARRHAWRRGAAADVVVIDPAAQWTVEPETFFSKSRNTPFGGPAAPGPGGRDDRAGAGGVPAVGLIGPAQRYMVTPHAPRRRRPRDRDLLPPAVAAGADRGQDGNVSVRYRPDRLLVTPRGLLKAELTPDDLVEVGLDGITWAAPGTATTELDLHLRVYRRRPDCGAVVHAHPPTATAFAVAGEGIPGNVLPEVAVLMGEVPLVPYATTGTPALGDAVEPFLEAHEAVLLANHGALAWGPSLATARIRMESLEHAARILAAARRPRPDNTAHSRPDDRPRAAERNVSSWPNRPRKLTARSKRCCSSGPSTSSGSRGWTRPATRRRPRCARKVRSDYEARLRGVIDELRGHAATIAEELDRHRGTQAGLDRERRHVEEDAGRGRGPARRRRVRRGRVARISDQSQSTSSAGCAGSCAPWAARSRAWRRCRA